jgi:hypothetical protein
MTTFDAPNKVIKNFLTHEEIEEVYSEVVKSSDNNYMMLTFNQKVIDFKLPESIKQKVLRECKKLSGLNDLVIEEYQFARYANTNNEDGTIGRPLLFPHRDEAFKQPRFTFDYQIFGNTDWAIVVEDNPFVLKSNEALTFSGTHQIHWRELKKFEEGEYIDMVFFHLRQENSETTSAEDSLIIKDKAAKYREIYDNEAKTFYN